MFFFLFSSIDQVQLFELLVGNGVLGVLVYFLMQHLIKTHTKSLSTLTRTITVHSVIIVSMQKALLAHDLTVTGINPSTGKDPGERATLALEKYDQIMLSLDEIKSALEKEISSLG